ncbi:MAG TPA: SOS response-associated peptidase family protein [Kofleriaceae bacterium]
MLDRYTLTALDEVAARFDASPPAGSVPRFNVAPLQQALIRTADGIAMARWGLLPPWRGHGGKRGPHVVRTMIELIDATPMLRNAFKKQRCLVIADGFYYWQQLEKKTQPLWMHVPRDDGRPQLLGFAAVAATHRDDDQLSFALLEAPNRTPIAGPVTGDAIWLEAPIPIDPAAYATWLTGPADAARTLLAPTPPAAWRAEPVSTYVNALYHDDERCIAPLRNPLQGQLF